MKFAADSRRLIALDANAFWRSIAKRILVHCPIQELHTGSPNRKLERFVMLS
ncbi:hypothetical protein X737_22345 [Mesorhizobium sp. L48C026A00]|nr:hypothetical protein X737_22345 [Mesorhizobium sp. L48C026A00]